MVGLLSYIAMELDSDSDVTIYYGSDQESIGQLLSSGNLISESDTNGSIYDSDSMVDDYVPSLDANYDVEASTGTNSDVEASTGTNSDMLEDIYSDASTFAAEQETISLDSEEDRPLIERMKRVHEPDEEVEPSKKKRLESSDDEDDGKLCPICLDIWSNSGEHRVCSLKCGHLFGHSCLLRWLESHTHSKRTCPSCKRKVLKNDIRFLYVKKLIAQDNTELDKLKEQLNTAIQEKNRLQLEMASLTLRMNQREHEFKVKIDLLKQNSKQTPHLTSVGYSMRGGKNEPKIFMDKSMEIDRVGGCRVMDYNKFSNTVAVSMSSPIPIFDGFGVRKIFVESYTPASFVPLHFKPVRDLSYQSGSELLLSVSLDKQAKLVDMSNNLIVSTFNYDAPLWSCCWDATNPYHLFVGGQQGGITKYDRRNPSRILDNLTIFGDMSPVVSLASTAWCPGDALHRGAVFCCKLSSCWVFEDASDGYKSFPLSLEGPFVSMNYDPTSKHLLVSARPSQRFTTARHTVCTLVRDAENGLACNVVNTFQGALTQKLLSRSCQLNVGSDVFVAAHHETNRNVSIWSVNRGERVSTVPAHLPVLDLCSITTSNGQFLASLNEKKLNFYQIEL